MSLSRLVAGTLGVAVIAAASSPAAGQNFPNRPIRIVCSQPGGGGDFAARLISNAIAGPLAQQVIVDNRASVLPGEIVAKAPPDGYTLLLDAASFWIGPLLQPAPYDPVKDFLPITLTDKSPSVLVVHPSVPAASVKELIALARAKPGSLNYGGPGPGSTPHLNTEMFKSMAGVNIVFVPYKGSGPAVIGLIAGEIQMMIGTAASVSAQIKAGKLKALAVTSPQPSPLFPGLPTIAASGVPGYDSEFIQGVFAPAKTAADVITKLNQEMVRALRSQEVRDKYLAAGIEPVGNAPEEFAAAIKGSISKWSKVIKDANIRVN